MVEGGVYRLGTLVGANANANAIRKSNVENTLDTG
jgi:hypothetical protein